MGVTNFDILDVDEIQIGTGKVPAGTQVASTALRKINYTTGDLDIEAEIIAAVNASNVAINAILTALVAYGIMVDFD